MKKILLPVSLFFVVACNNAASENNTTENNAKSTDTTTSKTPTPPVSNYAPENANSPAVKYTADGKEASSSGSILVSKDKDKLKPGSDWLCMLTANGGSDNESLTLNFLFDLKPGTYPVVGVGFTRGPSGNGQVFGGLLGGKPKLTNYTVTLTECTDMGSNNMGGHKWKLSGTFDAITVAAMPIMLMDKTKNHPAEITLTGGSFSNLLFDDNWEQMMEEGMKKMKK